MKSPHDLPPPVFDAQPSSLLRVMEAQVRAMSDLLEAQLGLVATRRGIPDTLAAASARVSPAGDAGSPPHAPASAMLPYCGPVPATSAQLELLARVQADPQAGRAYCETVALLLSGPLDGQALQQAWQVVGHRHEGLRLRVDRQGRFLLKPSLPVLRIVDGESSLRPGQTPDDDAHVWLERLMRRPMPVHGASLVRATLVRLSPVDHLLVLTAHHLMADGWSLALVLSEWAAVYSALRVGAAPDLEPATRWRDYLEWVQRPAPAAAPPQGVPTQPPSPHPPLVLSARRGPRPVGSALRGHRGLRIHQAAPRVPAAPGPRDLMAAARDCGRLLQASPVVVVLTAFAVFLWRLSGQRRLGIGLPVAGQTVAQMPHLVGMASTVMPLDIRLDGVETFRQAVAVVQEELNRARRYAASLLTGNARSVFPVSALFNIDPGVRLGMAGLRIEPLGLPLRHVKTGLFLNLLELNQQTLLDFDCHDELADAATARGWLDALLHLTGQVCERPDEAWARLEPAAVQALQPPVPPMPDPRADLNADPMEARASVPPRNEREARLARMWQEMLQLPELPGVTDDFFALGGHSLKAVALANRVALEEGCPVSLVDFFRRPTIEAMVQRLTEGGGVEPIARLAEGPGEVQAAEPSHAQRRMWVLEQLEGAYASYNMGFVLQRNGPMSEAATRSALQALAHRHQALRSALVEAQGDLALIAVRDLPLDLNVRDLRGRADASAERDLVARQWVMRRFDLARAPLWRVLLVRTDGGDALVVAMHHAVGDNWSITVWVRDFLTLLDLAEHDEPQDEALPELPVQYADYAAWHNRRIEQAQAGLAYWLDALSDRPGKLVLPTQRPRTQPAGLAPHASTMATAGATVARRLAPRVHQAFAELAQRRGASGFMVLTAAWRLWLWTLTGARDAIVGTVHAGRDHPWLADGIGLYVNTLALRVPLQPQQTFLELLDGVRRRAVEAFEHADVPFNRIVERLPGARDEPGHPLFDIVVTHDDMREVEEDLADGGWTVGEVDLPFSPFELILTGSEDAHGMELRLQFRTALWDADHVGAWLGEFEVMLERVCTHPQRPLDVLARPDAVVVPTADRSVVAHFEAWRHRQPQAPAVLGTPLYSYEDLGRAADALAGRLRAAGAGADEVVAVLTERSWDLPVSVLGVMKSSAAFVLLDPAHPLERLAFIMGDAGCRWLVHSEGHRELAHRLRGRLERGTPQAEPSGVAPGLLCLPVHEAAPGRGQGPEAVPRPAIEPAASTEPARWREHLAYLIYTSGSTGEPKGVLVDHGALSDHLEGITPLAQWTSADRSLLFATVAVDAVIEQLLLPLVNGSAFFVLDPERYSAQAYVQAWRRWGATILDVPPVFWGELITWCRQHPHDVAGLAIRTLMTGGEEMTPQRVQGWYGLPVYTGRILNLFGPTETTCSPVIAQVGPQMAARSRIPIGSPVGRRRIRIVGLEGGEAAGLADAAGVGDAAGVDDAARPDEGELLIGGASVARGYLHRPELTAERFVTDEQGVRWYRTGDRVRRRADGALEFLGRIDRQFKLRGFRIEPGEIEDAVRRCEGVQDVAVTVEAGVDGDELHAWLVLHPGSQPARSALVASLSTHLPPHMVPARWRCIAHLPISRTEKLDRAALRQMPAVDLGDGAEAAREADDASIVGRLCALVAEIVGVAAVKPADNFFAVGGHSLKAIQVVARVKDQLGVDIRLRDVFTAATLAELADQIGAAASAVASAPDGLPVRAGGEGGASRGRGDVIVPVPRDQGLPASAGQRRLWLLQSQQPDSVAFNMVAAFWIEGPLVLSALRHACRAVVRRHEVLRTRLRMRGGQLVQDILPDDGGLELELEQALGPDALEQAFQAELLRPFRLEDEIPIRLRLLRTPQGHGLVFNVHHAAFDGWSATVLLEDLAVLYGQARACVPDAPQASPQEPAVAGGLKPLAIQYADYAHWQQNRRASAQRDYWMAEFAGEPVPELQLPTDRPRPPQPSGRGAMVPRSFSLHTSQGLRDLAVREGVTLFGVMLALTVLHLHARCGQNEIVIGTAVAGRESHQLEDQIGFYVNMLPLRCRLDPAEPFRCLVGRLGRQARTALLNQDHPFDDLVYELALPRSEGRQPLFDVVLNLQNFKPMRLELEGVSTRLLQDRSVSSKYDLMYMIDDLDNLDLYLEYATDLFEAPTAQRMADEMVGLAEAAVLTPDIGLAELVAPWRAAADPEVPAATKLEDDEW